MSQKHVVVDGATCQCKFSVEPKTDVIKVKSQKVHFANEGSASKKLIASSKEIGQTLKKNTFGKCKMQPDGKGDYLPCQAVITKWSGAEKNIKLSNKGNPLVESSKATCPIGGSDCITIDKHGQKGERSKQNLKKADVVVHNQINPRINMGVFQAGLNEDDVT